jgi:fumarate reductase subunit D
MTDICPVCNKNDVVERVSTLVANGESIGRFSGPSSGSVNVGGKSHSVDGYATLSGSSITALAKSLKPPEEPTRSGLGILFWLAAVATGLWTCLVAPLALLGVLGLLGGLVSKDTSEAGLSFLYTGIGLVCLLPLWVITFIIYYVARRNKIQSEADYAYQKPRWDAAMIKWNRLYFCHRNGIVFDQNGETCEPSQIKEFVYK